LLKGIEALERTEDLVGRVTLARELTEGLDLYRISSPIGVICVVFESRPEAAVQISTLAVKSGNCVILKGGKEAALSNQALVDAMQEGLKAAGLPLHAIQLVNTREEVGELLKMNGLIDLVVPRGSNQLVKSVMEATSIPVLGHADGICSVYLDENASLDTAIKVAVDSKCNYPAACNAAETLLVHTKVLDSILVKVGAELAKNNVSFIADEKCFKKLPPSSTTLADANFRFNVEHLALILSVKCVESLDEAVNHINMHGSHHTDVIVTENEDKAKEFCRRVDSAGVYHNCSSRFADGFRYGFGAEGLLTYKYVAKGSGQTVGGMKTSDFTHRDLDRGLLNKPLDIFNSSSSPGLMNKRIKNSD